MIIIKKIVALSAHISDLNLATSVCDDEPSVLDFYHINHILQAFNPFSASQLSTTNFSLYNTYKI